MRRLRLGCLMVLLLAIAQPIEPAARVSYAKSGLLLDARSAPAVQRSVGTGTLVAEPESSKAVGKNPDGPPLAHMVFLEVKDHSAADRAKVVSACQKYLTDHEGTVYFSIGSRARELDRGANDKQFDVAVHLVFESKAAHDNYQKHPRHSDFKKSIVGLVSDVRVFDSYLVPEARP